MTDSDDLVGVVDSGWPTYFRSSDLNEDLPSFVKRGHSGDAAAIDAAFEQTTRRGEGVSVKIWGDLKNHQDAKIWQRLAQQFGHPRSVGRFADLAWCADPSDHDSARAAIAAYRECALPWVLDELDAAPEQWPASTMDGTPVEPEPGERWCFGSYRLQRSRRIAVFIGDARLAADIAAQAKALIDEQLNMGHGRAACRLFDVVIDPERHRPAWFADVALNILEQLTDAPPNWSTQLIDVLRTAPSPLNFSGDWPQHLDDLYLDVLVAYANSRDDELAKWKLLGEAAKWAEDRGMKDKASDLLQQWNAIDAAAHLEKRRTEVSLPADFAQRQEEMIQAMTAAVFGPTSAIAVIGAQLPANPEEADPTSIRSGLGLPNQNISEGRTSIAANDEDLERLDMMKRCAHTALTCADMVLIPALNRIHGKIGFNLVDWKSAWLASEFVDDKAATRLAEATRLFFENRCDTAAHILCPTIEHMLRRVAWQVGVVEPRPPHPGHDYIPPTLLPILERLENRIDEKRRVWFQHLLVDSMGFNLRNEIAHGTASLVNCQRTALLLNAAAWIANLTSSRTDEAE